MKLADKINLALQKYVKGSSGYEILIPNYYYGWHEMDLFRLMPSGLVIEYEIKISRSDFKADFKKEGKHERLQSGKGPNRFFFVVPSGLIKIEECPAYAGLIYMHEPQEDEMYWAISLEKNAPLLHNRKAQDVNPSIYKDLAQSLAFRERITKQKLHWCRRILKAHKLSETDYNF